MKVNKVSPGAAWSGASVVGADPGADTEAPASETEQLAAPLPLTDGSAAADIARVERELATELVALHQKQTSRNRIRNRLLNELCGVRAKKSEAHKAVMHAHSEKNAKNTLVLLNLYKEIQTEEADLQSQIDAVNMPRHCMKSLEESTAWRALLKSGDPLSPLLLRDMHTACAFVVIFIVFCFWAGTFGYMLSSVFWDCGEHNGCVSCALAIDNSSGACSPFVAASLEIRAGCNSFSIANNFTVIKDIVETIDRNVKTVWNLPTDLRDSLIAHGKIVNALQNNSNDQMTDPKPGPIKAMMKEHWYGINPKWQGGSDKTTDAIYRTVRLDEGPNRFVKMLHCHIFSIYRDFLYTNDNGLRDIDRATLA